MLVKGSTAMAGRSGCGKAERGELSFVGAAAGLGAVDLLDHAANEAKALSRNCPDQFLILAAVADGCARGIDSAGNCGIRYDPAPPDQGDEIILADDTLPVLHQTDQ
jgi:hypothetical protein